MTKRKSVERVAATAKTADEKARAAAKAGTSKAVDSFVNFAQNLGVGSDNALSTASYGFNPITRQRTLLEWIHRGSWLGGVAVDVVADDMTRAGIEIRGGVKPEGIEKLDEAATELGVWNKLNETIKWSRLYGGAVAVLLIDGQDPKSPLRLNTIRKGQFCGLLPLDRWMVEPSMSDLVTEFGPSLGLPKYYRVTAQAPALSGQQIHYSRVIRLEGITLPYWQRLMENLWGLSVLERLYDRMIAFDSASTGAAQLVYKSYMRTYKIKDMREIVAAGGDAQLSLIQYVSMMRKFQGIEGITLLDAEDDIASETHSAFGGLSDALAQFGQQLSGALQIPLVRLFGQSPTGFSTGDSDLRNYYDSIKQQQEKQLRVGLTKVYRVMAASEGVDLPEGTKLEFRSLWQLDEQQKATIAETVSRAVASAEESGLITRAAALKELRQSSQITGIFTNISEDDVTEAEAEGPPLPEDVTVAAIKAGELAPTTGEKPDTPPVKPGAKDSAVRQAAGILFLIQGTGKALLLRRGPGGDHPGTWATPAGHVELGETPEQAARREVFEETGYRYEGEVVKLHSTDGFTLFAAIIAKPFEVVLNAESTDYAWVAPGDRADISGYLHPGIKALYDENR